MTIYFLRHGETAWNRERRLQGSTYGIDLTDFGVRLSEWTRDGFAARGIRIDRAYTSPFRRAAHTAEIVMAGSSCPLVTDDRLREMCFGAYEGTRIGNDHWVDDNVRLLFQDPDHYLPPAGAESFAEVDARIRDFLDNEIAPLEGSCENVLAVSHGGLLRALLRSLQNLPLARFWVGRQPNCCIHIVRCVGGAFSLVEQSATFYDTKLAATLSSV